MPDEEALNKEAAKKFRDTRVNKKGQIYHKTEYDPPLDPPIKAPIIKKKKVKMPAPEVAPVETQPVVADVCPNCKKMSGIGPVAEWGKQQE